jgi:hypothetical protein
LPERIAAPDWKPTGKLPTRFRLPSDRDPARGTLAANPNILRISPNSLF